MEFNGHEVVITYKKIMRINGRIKNGKIYISAPIYVKEKDIVDFLNTNSKRIEKYLNREIITNENELHIWGIKYELIPVESTENKLNVIDDRVYVFYKKSVDLVIDNYLKNIVKDELDLIINKYKEIMIKENILFNKITIKKMKSRWGSCLCSKRNISINSNLGKCPKYCLEYVFCHEIAHIKYPNHSKKFHEFIYSYYKDEKLATKELKKHY